MRKTILASILGVSLLAVATYVGYNIQFDDQQSVALYDNDMTDEIKIDLMADAPDKIGVDLSDNELISKIHTRINKPNFSSAFLISQFAQRQQEWDDAAEYLTYLRNYQPAEEAILKKAIVLEMGANNADEAIRSAHDLLSLTTEDIASQSLASLFIVTGAFKDENYELAQTYLDQMPNGGLTNFIRPLMQGWLHAANGEFSMPSLKSNSLLLKHSIYIADYLDMPAKRLQYMNALTEYKDIALLDIERMADLHLLRGEVEKANALYDEILAITPNNKRTNLKSETADESLLLYHGIDNPRRGLSYAFYDMAYILLQDGSLDSARIFANMSLSLNTDLYENYVLLAAMAAQLQDYQNAISNYYSIPENSPLYLEARREAAHIYEDAGHPDRAIEVLQDLYGSYADMQALIQIGDTQRRKEAYEDAKATYLKVIDQLGGEISADYWQLHYVLGMVYERLGEWDLADENLRAALTYQPNHPFLLNYYGYALADQGLRLDEALTMIDKALSLQPQDGYITDSLGWVYYRLGRYEDAVPYLERAVELRPADAVINDHLGDAYWKVGRRIEARYQWQRAKLFVEDDATLEETIVQKIADGLQADNALPRMQAHSEIEAE